MVVNLYVVYRNFVSKNYIMSPEALQKQIIIDPGSSMFGCDLQVNVWK